MIQVLGFVACAALAVGQEAVKTTPAPVETKPTAAPAPAAAPANVWALDADHASVSFSVRHLAVSNVKGEFTKLSGTLEYDGKDTTKAKLDITIDATSINTRHAKRDEHLKNTDFIDTAKFPTITFKAKRATAVKGGKFKLTGDLTLRGVTKEVTLDVAELTAPVKDPWGNMRVGAQATTTINRKDFGASWNQALDNGGLVVGNDVKITIDAEFTQKA